MHRDKANLYVLDQAEMLEIENLNKKLDELLNHERSVLYVLAVRLIEIDTDNGVKVKYAIYG